MSLYGAYDDFYANNTPPNVLGGKNRAANAVRDKYGRFLPTEPWRRDFHEPSEPHGKAGGEARARTGARSNGRYVKEQLKP